jgi:hypothetical protein
MLTEVDTRMQWAQRAADAAEKQQAALEKKLEEAKGQTSKADVRSSSGPFSAEPGFRPSASKKSAHGFTSHVCMPFAVQLWAMGLVGANVLLGDQRLLHLAALYMNSPCTMHLCHCTTLPWYSLNTSREAGVFLVDYLHPVFFLIL